MPSEKYKTQLKVHSDKRRNEKDFKGNKKGSLIEVTKRPQNKTKQKRWFPRGVFFRVLGNKKSSPPL